MTRVPVRPRLIEDYLRSELAAFRHRLGLDPYRDEAAKQQMKGAEMFVDHLIGKKIRNLPFEPDET